MLQRYIWQNELDNRKIHEDKVIETLIYRVKSSGNKSERDLRETASLQWNSHKSITLQRRI